MKYYYILLLNIVLTCCIQGTDEKGDKTIIDHSILEIEDIYSNQQKYGDELGPWWIFYKVNIRNITDSTISIFPKKDLVDKEALDKIQAKYNFRGNDISRYIIKTPGFGDVFLLFKHDTIPLYCKTRPIVLSIDSCNNYRFYTDSEEIEDLYHRLYTHEYDRFQDYLSSIVKSSTLAVVFNKKDTCYFYPNADLNFYGDPLEQAEWSFH